MSSEEALQQGNIVLTPLSDLVVDTEGGVEVVLGTGVVKDIHDDVVVVAFDTRISDNIGEIAAEQGHAADGRIVGVRTAEFTPEELLRADNELVYVPRDELRDIPPLR